MTNLISSHRERDDNYVGTVVNISARWRVATCRDHLQWVLMVQRGAGPHGWRADSYCQTREALMRCIRERGLLPSPAASAILAGLPSHIRAIRLGDATEARDRAAAQWVA